MCVCVCLCVCVCVPCYICKRKRITSRGLYRSKLSCTKTQKYTNKIKEANKIQFFLLKATLEKSSREL